MSSSSADNFYKILYFTSVAGASILFGFSRTISKLNKEQAGAKSPEAGVYEEAVALARKALLRSTIYSCCGFGLFLFGSYHLFGKKLIERRAEEFKKSDGPTSILSRD